MSTPQEQIKSAVAAAGEALATAETNALGDAKKAASQVGSDLSSLRARITSLEMHTESLYAKHTRLVIAIVAFFAALIAWKLV